MVGVPEVPIEIQTSVNEEDEVNNDEDNGELGGDVDPEDNYHSSTSSDDERGSDSDESDEYDSRFEEFEDFVDGTDNVYRDEEAGAEREPEQRLEIGMMWATLEEARTFIRSYAISNRFSFKQVRNEKRRLKLKCKDETCDWNVYVGLTNDKHTYKLGKSNLLHTCAANAEDKNPMVSSQWIAQVLIEEYSQNQDMTVEAIRAWVRSKHGVNVTYKVAWNAKNILMEMINGNFEEGYRLAPEMARQILLSNPGSVATVSRDDPTGKFTGMCVCFKSSIDGFLNGCRPVIGLDGCFLKGKYVGVCLSILSLDACNGLFPIAIYICRKECKETWLRFLEYVGPYLQGHANPLTIISDRQKGLVDAVETVFGNGRHRYCFRHMYKNFKQVHPGLHLEELAWNAAKSYRRIDYDKWMSVMESTNPAAKAWLLREDPSSWARSHFDPAANCEYITNNFSESFNSQILKMRDKPLCKMIEMYWLLIMSTIYTRKMKARQWQQDGLVPKVAKELERRKKNIRFYIVQPSDTTLLNVSTQDGTRWQVDLTNHTCTCCSWQISGIPCVHAMCVLVPRRENLTNFCSSFFSVAAYSRTYENRVNPIPDESAWGEPLYVVKPPTMSRPAGRPRKERRRDRDESSNKRHSCSTCGNYGHNKKSCRGAPPPTTGAASSSAAPTSGAASSCTGPTTGATSSSTAVPSTNRGRGRGGRRATGWGAGRGGGRGGGLRRSTTTSHQQQPQQQQQQTQQQQSQQPQQSQQESQYQSQQSQQPQQSQQESQQSNRPVLVIPGRPETQPIFTVRRGRGGRTTYFSMSRDPGGL